MTCGFGLAFPFVPPKPQAKPDHTQVVELRMDQPASALDAAELMFLGDSNK